MKKLLLISLAAFVMTNCAKESVVDSDLAKNGNIIGFSTYSNITRGNPVDDNTEFLANGNSFGVTAFISTTSTLPYMGAVGAGAEIESNGTTWNYKNSDDTRFWPTNGETLSFYAYAPFANTNRTAAPAFTKTGGMIFTDYTVSATVSDQEDFMYTSALNVAKATPAVAVPLTFHHAMTQILFKARVKSDANLYVDIDANGISLHNINSKGTFMLAAAGTAGWSAISTSTIYTVPSAAVTVNGTTGTDTDIKNVFIADNVLMLLPQEFAAWNKETFPTPTAEGQTGSYLSLKCKLYYVDQNDGKQYLFGSAGAFGTINVPFSSKDGGDTPAEIWKMRNRITYTLLIDGSMAGLEPITFTTDVEGWKDATGGSIDL